MSDAVAVALITVVIGGIFTAVLKLIDRKAESAKEEMSRNTAEVEAVNAALEGMQILLINQRIESDRKEEVITRLRQQIRELRSQLDQQKGAGS